MSEIRAWSAAREIEGEPSSVESAELDEPVVRQTRIEPSGTELPKERCPRGHDAPILPVDGTAYFVCAECGLLLTASTPTDTLAA